MFETKLKPAERSQRRHGSAKRHIVPQMLKTALMVSVLSVGGQALSVTDASAQNLFQKLFNPEYHRKQRERDRRSGQALLDKVKKARVSAPRYLTYKADAWKPVSLAALSEKKTAVTEPETTAVGGAAEVEIETDAVTVPPVVLTEFDKGRPALAGLSLTVIPEVGEALIAFYREHPDFLWVSEGKPNTKALAVRDVLAGADAFALDPNDYLVGLPENGADPAPDDMAAAMAFEMEMTAAVLTYALDATRGRIDPNRISEYHDLPRHEVDLVAVAEALVSTSDVKAELEGHHPQHEYFAALVAELERLKVEDEEADQIVIAPGTFLKSGATSSEVKNIVAAIRKEGSAALLEEHAETLAAYADGDVYTPELVALVKGFQKEKNLSADGIVGKNTISAMVGETNAAKIAKVRLAMERSRWLPEDLGERKVFINQPAFTATYVAPDQLPLSMRVIVGKKSNQTNFFYDKIEIVEYNPYWGVPYSIIVNEMIPKLASNPRYLDESGYEVTTLDGRQVSSAAVDWYAVAAREQSINVRQYPGQSNALGEVKILFPNRHHIYMHDTPAKSLFNKDVRAFSHGCIRLHDPKAMAAAVLGKSKDYVSSRIGQGQNQQERVEGDLPVYVSYFTAWPEVDGSVGYYSDIYDRDRYLLNALETTDATRAAARSS